MPSQGNSNSPQYYNLIDETPYAGLSYYRLQQTDIDGSSSYVGIVSVNIDRNEDDFIQIMPNPTTGQFEIVLDVIEEQNTEVQIHDVLGRLIEEHDLSLSKGINSFNFDISRYPDGAYIVTIKTNGGQFGYTRRLIKTHP